MSQSCRELSATIDSTWRNVVQQRNRRLAKFADSPPGREPYENHRPINVSSRFEGQTILDVMTKSHPHIGIAEWQQIFAAGRIRKGNEPLAPSTRVRGGQQYTHCFPYTTEPDVNCAVSVIYEDDELAAIDKPAPLPLHPSGRFNRNTLVRLLEQAYGTTKLRHVHRLDANTSGVLLFTKSAATATLLIDQIEQVGFEKTYLVRCVGWPSEDEFTVVAPISRFPGQAGIRVVDEQGKHAVTHFRCLQRDENGTSLLKAYPKTGRTNQIRVHLWSINHPVVGDPLYLENREIGGIQTLTVDAPPMCLHAMKIEFDYPRSCERVSVQASVPVWADQAV